MLKLLQNDVLSQNKQMAGQLIKKSSREMDLQSKVLAALTESAYGACRFVKKI